MDLDLSVSIAAERRAVYAVLADVQRYATGPGSPVLAMDKQPPGETDVGTRWRERLRGGGMAGWLRYTLRDDGPGRSVPRQEAHIDLWGPLRLFDPLVRAMLEPRHRTPP